MTKKKKIVLLSVMVVLLVVSGVANFMLTDASNSIPTLEDEVISASSFFSAFRTDRTSTREQTIMELDAIISSQDTSLEAKTAAEEMKLKICANMQTEFDLESLIKAQGFSEAVVTVGSQNINILVNDDTLEANEVAKIFLSLDNASRTFIDVPAPAKTGATTPAAFSYKVSISCTYPKTFTPGALTSFGRLSPSFPAT
jgi:hypothetical protein